MVEVGCGRVEQSKRREGAVKVGPESTVKGPIQEGQTASATRPRPMKAHARLRLISRDKSSNYLLQYSTGV